MCGIAGIAGACDERLVRAMTDTLRHRGPDGEGCWTDHAETVLGHRRLAIIDLAAGAQPMAYADGRFRIVFNGEIYNYRELRARLEPLGHAFRTQSDTEVILAAYAAWGAACIEQFQGMFAFALWDAREKELFLARDPIGVKPLYYAELPGRLYFASEMKALFVCPEISREIDMESLDDYLTYLYTVPPRTFYRGIRQLPPGHAAVWKHGRLRVYRYWQPSCAGKAEEIPEKRLIEELDALLADTIDRYLIADVPLGAFLSGGLDSNTIVQYIAQRHGPPETFTIGFGEEGRRYDESAQARETALRLQTRHHELRAEPDVAALLPVMVRHFDEPFGNPTALLTYTICRLVRDHVTVVLSGDGGDEGFGGYPRYRGMLWAERYQRVPQWLRRAWIHPLVQRLPESTAGLHALRRLREFSQGSFLDRGARYAYWVGYYTAEEKSALYAPEVAGRLAGRDAHEHIRSLMERCDCAETDSAARAMCVDIQSFLPNNVLQYGDRMSMAHSLEVRVPLADHRLLERLMRVSGRLKMKGGKGKYLLRRLMQGRLPDTVVTRAKQGFNPPMGAWLNGPLRPMMEDCLSPDAMRAAGWFNPETVTGLIRDHRSGRRDYTWHLWALIVLEQWRRGCR